MIGHRPSILGLAQFCGMAPELQKEQGAGRAAAMSTAWHAWCAGQKNHVDLLARLTPDEQATVKSWPKPADVVLESGLLLAYSTAEHELQVGIDGWGEHCDPDSPDCLTSGTLDFAWRREDVAYVADLKKSKWTCPEGPESLQLHAYGWSYAKLRGCKAYITGLWIAESGEWQWSHQPVVLDSPEGERVIERVVAAASNITKEFNVGPHCSNCYARSRCPEHTISAAAAETWLAPLVGGNLPNPTEAADVYTRIEAAEDVLKKAKDMLKGWVEHGQLQVTFPDGKQLVPVQCAGRKSLDREALEQAFGADAIADYEKQGAPYYQWKKMKPKGAGK